MDADVDSYRQCVASALDLIPTHRQSPKSARELTHELTRIRPGLSEAEAGGVIKTILAMLEVFGLLTPREDGYQLSGQVPSYFLQSLKWYFEHDASLFGNWNSRRARRNGALPLDSLLGNAPHFLRLVEERRLQLAEQLGVDAAPVRSQAAVMVLVKAMIDGESCFLHQYDEPAGQYQLIGGRIEPDETVLQAAVREFLEEVGEHQDPPLQEGKDFTLAPLIPLDEPICLISVSPTYGVLTSYVFNVCVAHLNVHKLALTSLDRWLTVDEMLNGRTKTGEGLGNSEISVELDGRLPGGLRSAPLPSLQLLAGHDRGNET